MKNLKIFPKIFIQTFLIIGLISLLIHWSVFLIFPRTYLDSRKAEIYHKANEISRNMNGKELSYIEQTLDFYSNTGEIKAFVKGRNGPNEIKIKKQLHINLASEHNSLIIEERAIKTCEDKEIFLQFVSTADMQADAKNLSFKFLPYSMLLSLLFSSLVSFVYAKSIKNHIQEIKNVTDKMMELDKQAHLQLDSKDEISQLKGQINDLYATLLKSIHDLQRKNNEIVKLEKLKYDFLRGASHELKTPLASLKIILENMEYNIGKYKDRDMYIPECITLVDNLSKSISQILSVHAIENLNNDEENVQISEILEDVLKKYEVLVNQKNIRIHNSVHEETIYIGRTALKIILSNLISNAVKYTNQNGIIQLGIHEGWFYIENSQVANKIFAADKLFEVKFDLNKENSHGLGLYIVSNLLRNYQIKYKVEQAEKRFIFQMKLSAESDVVFEVPEGHS